MLSKVVHILKSAILKIKCFEEGNAFDTNDLASITPAPTLGIVSGLYELFPSNDLIRASLSGLSQAILLVAYLSTPANLGTLRLK